MRLHFRHPTVDDLGGVLSDSADESRAWITAHLKGCQRCRDTVQFVREASNAASAIPPVGPSESLLGRVLDSRASDTRMILPIVDPGESPKRHWALPARIIS